MTFEGLIHDEVMADAYSLSPHPNNPFLIFIDQTVLLPQSSPTHEGNTPKNQQQ